MTELLHYGASRVIRRTDLPLRKFAGYFRIYGYGVAPVDRTGTIKLPINTHSLFALPEFKEFKASYEEVCDERAQELIEWSNDLDCPIHVFWSGGVDSTCVLVSLLKASKQHDNITVLLSEESINEYPLFYEKFIRGKLQCKSSLLFPLMLGTSEAVIVNGEGNDQLMGSDIIGEAMRTFGAEAINGDYDERLFLSLFEQRLRGDTALAKFYARLFHRLRKAAPIAIDSNFAQFWWVNFCLKWQTVFMRSLSYATGNITKDWVKRFYFPFFMTQQFQLWSLNNIDKRIKGSWASYKFPAKELIYKYTDDPAYRDKKIKRGSLAHLVLQQRRADFVTSDYQFPDELEPAEFYREDHEFR